MDKWANITSELGGMKGGYVTKGHIPMNSDIYGGVPF